MRLNISAEFKQTTTLDAPAEGVMLSVFERDTRNVLFNIPTDDPEVVADWIIGILGIHEQPYKYAENLVKKYDKNNVLDGYSLNYKSLEFELRHVPRVSFYYAAETVVETEDYDKNPYEQLLEWVEDPPENAEFIGSFTWHCMEILNTVFLENNVENRDEIMEVIREHE